MEYSLSAWLGGLAGTIIAVAAYVPAIRIVERRWRAQRGPQTLEQRATFEDRLSLTRRAILAAAVAGLATAGYWLGKVVSGSAAGKRG
jgi:ABC-type uncharacterized transport system YnjBCD permease subunit